MGSGAEKAAEKCWQIVWESSGGDRRKGGGPSWLSSFLTSRERLLTNVGAGLREDGEGGVSLVSACVKSMLLMFSWRYVRGLVSSSRSNGARESGWRARSVSRISVGVVVGGEAKAMWRRRKVRDSWWVMRSAHKALGGLAWSSLVASSKARKGSLDVGGGMFGKGAECLSRFDPQGVVTGACVCMVISVWSDMPPPVSTPAARGGEEAYQRSRRRAV